ncbi:hypothetical protein [Lentilitoribacter sp. Alg239-R112]|uniref:hypothetical protein n=1 Tax=Lentilitoribacter sp. Alg239-R112 TaxID=2305987 RepID=UPI0013A6CE8D|nr:hypothetical protein [Lentilitoribacter sp. Alg239-R112]
MGGGGSAPTQTTTQQSSSTPWAAAQPYMKTGMKEADKLFKAGTGAKVYEGSTVTPWSDQTTAGYAGMEGIANDNSNGQGLSGQFQSVIDNGGYNANQQQAVDSFTATANGTENDEAYQRMRANTLEDAQHAVNESFSSAGRYGGAMHQGAVAENIADAGARMDYGQLQRQDAANSNLFNMGQQAQGNVSNAYQQMQSPWQTQLEVGAAHDQLAGQNLNDKLRIWQEKQNKPWQQLGQYNSAISGVGSGYGSSSMTAQQPGQPGANPWGQAAGLALGAGSLFGGF